MITFNSTQNNIAFGALVPKKDYAGPILKLTKNEKAKIDNFQKKIGELIIEREKLCVLRNKTSELSSLWDYYADAITRTCDTIDYLRAEIAKIKAERFAKQKARFEAKKSLNIEG